MQVKPFVPVRRVRIFIPGPMATIVAFLATAAGAADIALLIISSSVIWPAFAEAGFSFPCASGAFFVSWAAMTTMLHATAAHTANMRALIKLLLQNVGCADGSRVSGGTPA